MATFTNQATLTYNNQSVNSNVVTGEIVEVITAEKTAVKDTYNGQDVITYIVNIFNSGTSDFTGLNLSDNLGEYPFGTSNVVPENYIDGTLRYFINGVAQTSPAPTTTSPLNITDITVPAGGNTTIVYSVNPNEYAPLATGSTINNVATLSGAGLTADVPAAATITAEEDPVLSIEKSLNPSPVVENGTITYTFVIENTGNTEADAADNLAVTDTFNPILDLTSVTLNGTPLAETTGYTYDAATGQFATVPGQITVPAATYTQDPLTGAYTTVPGRAELVVTGTI